MKYSQSAPRSAPRPDRLDGQSARYYAGYADRPGGSDGYVKAEELRVLNMMFDAKRLPPVLLELYNHSGYKYLFAHNFDYYKERDFPSLIPSEEEFETLIKQ